MPTMITPAVRGRVQNMSATATVTVPPKLRSKPRRRHPNRPHIWHRCHAICAFVHG